MAKKSGQIEKTPTGASFKLDASAFAKLGGEHIAGLSILKLQPNEAAGPFVLKRILLNQKLGKGAAAESRKPVDVYVAEFEGKEIRMPAAAGFVGKAKDANLSIGDTFALLRVEDYVSKEWGTKGQGFELRIISRAKK